MNKKQDAALLTGSAQINGVNLSGAIDGKMIFKCDLSLTVEIPDKEPAPPATQTILAAAMMDLDLDVALWITAKAS